MGKDAQPDRVRLPWWPDQQDAAPSREPLTRGQIVAAAIRVSDAEGLEALSIRRLAGELGSGATSLYRHVRSKEELLDLVVDEVLGEVPDSGDPTTGWQDRAAAMARAVRDTLRSHPGAALAMGARVTRGPNALALADRLLGILRSAGLGGAQLGLAYQAIFNWAIGFAAADSRVARSGSDRQSLEEQQAVVSAMLAALPADRYPNLVITFDYANELTPDAQFEFGLRAMLDGIAAALKRQRTEMPRTIA